MLKLLVPLDKVQIFSKPYDESYIATVGKVKPGQVVAINADGKVVPPPADGYPVAYIVLSDWDEPVSKAAGTISLLFGDSRFEISEDDIDLNGGTLAAGEALYAGTNCKFKLAVAGGTPIAYIERIYTKDGKNIVVCRWA